MRKNRPNLHLADWSRGARDIENHAIGQFKSCDHMLNRKDIHDGEKNVQYTYT